jgi:hypothetical protein
MDPTKRDADVKVNGSAFDGFPFAVPFASSEAGGAAREERERLFTRRALLRWSLPATAAVAGVLLTPRFALAAPYHVDTPGHVDVAHVDLADPHFDTPHADGNNHTDTWNGIAGTHYDMHGDYPHLDHNDAMLTQHKDTAHGDHNDHGDHSDVHGDVPHGDFHFDGSGALPASGHHDGNNHTDAPWHYDMHGDSHVDEHNDAANQVRIPIIIHTDVPHVDHTDAT